MKGDDLHPQASFFVQLQRMFHLGFILVKDASLIGSISSLTMMYETVHCYQVFLSRLSGKALVS